MQLERAQQQLIHKDRLMALGEMSTSVAHEINQPLSFIRGLSEHVALSIERGSLNLEKLPEIVGKIIGGVDRITEIIQHIREFARTGKEAEVVLVPIDPVVAVERAIRFFTAKFHSHSIDFQFSADPNLPQILGDHGLLEQVVVNLLSNAYHAVSGRMENDTISVVVSLVDQQVQISVEDNGMGMDKVTRLHALEPFYTKRDDGTGLGLSIVYGIVRDFNGEVLIDSELNVGTTLTLCFPVNTAR
jgi:histidine kinase